MKEKNCNTINSKSVRLIDHEGKNLGIVETRDAYKLAESVGLDLVQVDGSKNIPVCKIMDYGKWKYEQSKKQKAARVTQQTTKELKIRPNTDDHDLQYRAKQALEFLDGGDKVRILVRFKGRERTHMMETGKAALEKFLSLMDITKYKMDKPAEASEKEICIILSPVK